MLEIAAGDHRVAAVISQCPFTSGIASALAISPRSSIKVAPLALRDNAAARKGRDPVYVEVVGPPGSRALMTAADALPGVEALVEGIPEYENRLCARIGLRVIRYRPGRRVARIAAPVLFCICERDSVAPARASRRYARRARRGEVRLYPVGHFDVYFGEAFERAVADQLDFLARQVGG